ncbi:TAXI family TRAP transporter solute-binding subunit [Actinomadura sp. DC4]|uniref:TAXI family TRAP transporter solute-binding subunit n=1 Tax=Actinomadura sp. DC4 TaxID=3055069 RepID=UPI0025B039A0|nr:TAXI family TRAP transporter solute-binding subunit [Actinomadura sp. DC4]MDN3357549.1 TAXI family TRAP transporter solute-binding subunit [Actinomadura sp. DC4]
MRWVTVLVVALLTVAACGERVVRPWRLVIATGGQGAVYYAYGQGLARAARGHLPGAEPTVLSTAASVENLRLVADGKADVAFALADSAALAFAGKPPFDRREPVVALARLYENYTHLVVPAGSGIRRPADLRGRVVAIGAAGSGTELIATRLLTAAGAGRDVRVRRLQLEDSATALRDGSVDAFFFSGGLPTGTIAELARTTPIRLIDLGDYAERLGEHYQAFYEERSIPASAYGLTGPVRTVGVPNYLVVNAAMPADRAYALTRMLFEQKDALAVAHPEALHLNLRAAISTSPLPLHPGAVRYYRTAKQS